MKRGQITVFFSLLLPLLLALIGAVLESAYQQAMRSQIERSLVLCEYSFLSEYQKELWESYGLFYLDSGYGTREESVETIKTRLLSYLNQNLSLEKGEAQGIWMPFQAGIRNIQVSGFSRMTDDRGMGFYEQAVAFEQNLWGADLMTVWLDESKNVQEFIEQGEDYQQADERERRNLEVLRRRRLQEEEQDTEDPTNGIRQGSEGILTLVIEEPEQLSVKAVSKKGIPSQRTLLQGTGSKGEYESGLVNDQWFHTYLLERCTNAKEVLLQEKEAGGWLSYEMEYILAGKSSDQENLKTVANRILLLREGINYAYLMTDEGKKQEAYLLALAVAGLTMMPELVDALQQVILLSWAYGESVLDVRSLLQGKKVDIAKTGETWKLPLSHLFFLRSHLDTYDGKGDENGLSYEGYLRMLLTITNREEKCMRGLDIIEGNLRTTELGKKLYVDQCLDALVMKVDVSYPSLFAALAGQEVSEGAVFTAERRLAYEW